MMKGKELVKYGLLILFLSNVLVLLVYETTSSTIDEKASVIFEPRFNGTNSNVSIFPSLNYGTYDPIEVASDADFEIIEASGLGTKSNPYVIRGWNITTNGVHGIYIHDTTKYFIIQDCWISTGDVSHVYGIYIKGVATGTATIIDNNCQNSHSGIYLKNSDSSWVVNNTCRQNTIGISVENSDSSWVVNNTCRQNGYYGISLWKSKNIIAEKNFCNQNGEYGIYLRNSQSSSVVNNFFSKDGLVMEGDIEGLLSHSIMDNWVNGLPLGFIKSLHDITLTSSYGQLILVNCTNILVQDQNCSNSSIGITLHYSSYCQLLNNTCNHNNKSGVTLSHSSNTTIVNNICSQNFRDGVYLEKSRKSTIENNTCIQNGLSGIMVRDSKSITIISNVITHNRGGIGISWSDNAIVKKNICNQNGIGYQSSGSGINLHFSDKSVVTNNTCGENEFAGISINYSNSTFCNNTCEMNEYGIHIGGESAMVTNNICKYNIFGIYLIFGIYHSYNAYHFVISGNTLIENQSYGIYISNSTGYIEGLSIFITFNNFFNNNNGHIQACDDGSNSQWINNYWSDYSGTGEYQIDGSAGARDSAPLANPHTQLPESKHNGLISLPFFAFFLTIIGIKAYYRHK